MGMWKCRRRNVGKRREQTVLIEETIEKTNRNREWKEEEEEGEEEEKSRWKLMKAKEE